VFGGANVDCCCQLGGGEIVFLPILRFLTDSSQRNIAVILCDQLFYAELFDLSNVEPADL